MKTKQGTNSSEMRSSNELLILNMLRKQTYSRAQIAKLSGLSRAGVTILVDNLMQRGFLRETDEQDQGLGRKAMGLRICEDVGYVVGIHLRRNDCGIGVFDFLGKLLYQRDLTYDAQLAAIAQLVSVGKAVMKMLEEYGIDAQKVFGVGLCTSGPVDVSAGKVIRLSSKWHEIEIVRVLESVLPWPCHLTNRSTARTMYEKFYGVCRSYSNFIFLKVDESVGGGVVVGERLLSGYNQFGNEFGHMTIKCDGEQCECGNIGCLELYASVPALLQQFKHLGKESWQELMDAAYLGEVDALQAVRQEVEYLSCGIVSMCNLLEPQAIVLAGSIVYRPSLLVALIRENVSTRRILRNCHDIDILVAEEASHMNIRAAAAIVIEKLYGGELEL
ncbi:MAG: ROK family protein [Candidatus Limiplasma sp.]|nr:ROK family protein [Candidatus Limiplasma sp.]